MQINVETASAQLYLYESFGSYSVNKVLNGVNGWLYNSGSDVTHRVQNTTPLTYPNLVTDANYFIGGYAYLGVGLGLNSAFFQAYRSAAGQNYASYKAGGTNEFWFSFLSRQDVANNRQLVVAFGGNASYTSDRLNFSHTNNSANGSGITTTHGEWQTTGNTGTPFVPTIVRSNVFTDLGAVTLTVCKVNLLSNGTNTLSLYVNPTVGITPTTPVAVSTSDAQNISVIAFYLSFGTFYSIDEIRVGATYADVTPSSLTVGIAQNKSIDANIYAQEGHIVADLSKLSGISQLTVIDAKGSVIKSENIKGSELLNINVPSKGLYLVRLQNGVNQTTHKVIL